MNINDMTIGQAKELAAMFGGEAASGPVTPHIGKRCIVRTYASGVHFGTVVAQSGRQVEISASRRLWKFHCKQGISLSDVAVHGIDQDQSRICAEVAAITILDALEIIPATDAAAKSITEAPVASK
jgi:hypothetical protein